MWEKLPTNQDVIEGICYHLKIKKYTLKTMSATYDEITAVWKKVARGATPGYTCFLSKNTVLKKLNDLFEMSSQKTLKLPQSINKNGIRALTSFLTYQGRIWISIFLRKIISIFKIRKDPDEVFQGKTLN